MWKLKIFYDFKKEEQWLQEMSHQGYRLTKASYGSYHFDYCNIPGDFNIKIDYRTFRKQQDFMEYLALFEDSGWQHIAGTKNSGTQYFVKAREDAYDDIFTDHFSRAGRYKRVSDMWFALGISYTPIAFMFISQNHGGLQSIFHLKSLYLTPGLWDMKGFHFLLAFLFETPFALLRGFGWTFFIFFIIFYAYYAMKSYQLYKKELRKGV